MPKITMSDRACQGLKPVTGQKQTEYFDARTRGLALRVSGKGKTWVFSGRVGSRTVRLRLGTYPGTSLADAREEAERVRSDIRRGNDPVAERRAKLDAVEEAQENTFGNLVERFLRVRVRPRLRSRTVEAYERIFDHLTHWTHKDVRSIKRSDLIAFRDELEARGQHAQARLHMTMIGAFFAWMKDETGLIEVNPATRIKFQKSASELARDRVLTIDELVRIWKGAEKGLGTVAETYIKFLILTALRRNEASMILWSYLDLDAKEPTLTLPASITKSKREMVVPLVPEVVALLLGLPRFAAADGQAAYVFSSYGKGKKIGGYSKAKNAIDDAMKEPISDWRFHDFRRAFSTYANDHDLASGETIELCLAHESHRAGVKGTYDKSKRLPQRRRLMTLWTQIVLSAVEGRPATDNVVPMLAQ